MARNQQPAPSPRPLHLAALQPLGSSFSAAAAGRSRHPSASSRPSSRRGLPRRQRRSPAAHPRVHWQKSYAIFLINSVLAGDANITKWRANSDVEQAEGDQRRFSTAADGLQVSSYVSSSGKSEKGLSPVTESGIVTGMRSFTN